ncbi:hypothetical protein CDL15_Pgr026249 [Punica granatum]|uniref:Uncharacterized protein n=1 Tax=Punica granatum TaxID=22663 RepID=A0A218VT82_PUNGR|nr:hypothetical protein CDL15_Pgr026249 [Punica granatum]
MKGLGLDAKTLVGAKNARGKTKGIGGKMNIDTKEPSETAGVAVIGIDIEEPKEGTDATRAIMVIIIGSVEVAKV